MIPKIIHQIRPNDDMPKAFRHWQSSWKRLNPEYEYRLWTDADLHQLIETTYPDWRNILDSYRTAISRTELARYLILHCYGGVYADLDYACLAPLDELLQGRSWLASFERFEHEDVGKVRAAGLEKVVCNAFLASVPAHPFWQTLFRHLQHGAAAPSVLDAIGRSAFTHAWQAHDDGALEVLDAQHLYPVVPAADQAATSLMSRIETVIGTGEWGTAAPMAAQMLAMAPEDSRGWTAYAIVLQAQGRLDDAVSAARRALALHPEEGSANVNAHRNLARLLLQQKCWAEALAHYQVALIHEARDAVSWREAAYCCHALAQWREAEACARNSLYLQPRQVPVLILLGQILEAQQRHDEARPAFERAAQLEPQSVHARQGQARVAMVRGSLTQAVAHYRQALALQLSQPLPSISPAPSCGFDDPGIQALMWRTLAQLAAAGVHAFATSGTLLGLVRDGRLLPFDKDLDFGLPFDELDRARACLLAQGWQEGSRALRLRTPQSFRHRETGTTLDLCGFLDDPVTGGVIGGFWQAGQPWSQQRITDYPGPLRLNHEQRPEGRVWVLQDPVPWLAALYGAAWRTPDPDFDTVVAACNLRGFAPLTECYGFMRIGRYIQEGRLQKALATTRHCLRYLPDDALLHEAEAILVAALQSKDAVLTAAGSGAA